MEHLALIMDGNRRWAIEHKFKTAMHGYENASDGINTAIQFCIEQKIKYLSLFAFSSENLEMRSNEEKKYLWNSILLRFGQWKINAGKCHLPSNHVPPK